MCRYQEAGLFSGAKYIHKAGEQVWNISIACAVLCCVVSIQRPCFGIRLRGASHRHRRLKVSIDGDARKAGAQHILISSSFVRYLRLVRSDIGRGSHATLREATGHRYLRDTPKAARAFFFFWFDGFLAL